MAKRAQSARRGILPASGWRRPALSRGVAAPIHGGPAPHDRRLVPRRGRPASRDARLTPVRADRSSTTAVCAWSVTDPACTGLHQRRAVADRLQTTVVCRWSGRIGVG